MEKLKKTALILLSILLIGGIAIFMFVKANAGHTVLKVISGDTVYIDFNNNGVAERDEKKGLSDIAAFETRAGYRLNEQMKEYNLSEQEVLELGYLARELLEKKVLNKKVKVKFVGKKKYYVLLYLDGKLVQDELIESGYVVPYKYSRRYWDNRQQVEHAKELLQGRKLKEKPYEQEVHAHKEKVLEKPSPDVHTKFIDLYFIDPTKYDKPANCCRTSACQALLNEINNAKESIYFAIYGISGQPEIFNALIDAEKRGVKIRGVTDITENGKNIYRDTGNLMEKLAVKGDYLDSKEVYLAKKKLDPIQEATYKIKGQTISAKFRNRGIEEYSEQIMHNKFFVFDNQKVWTGSTNVSSAGIGGYNSNIGTLVNSEKIANLYTEEFNQMFEEEKFHENKSIINNNENIVFEDGSVISVYFSPDKRVYYNGIKPLIEKAEKYVYVPAFFFTHKWLPQLLINAYERGVDVKVIVDATSAKTGYSKHKILRLAGIPTKVENWGGKSHIKSIIIDDRYIIVGSMNFTNGGIYTNDENTLIIENPVLAKNYRNFFEKIWKSIPDKWLNQDPDPESPDSVNSCSDRVDNDFDGFVDSEDPGCAKQLQVTH